MSVLRPSAPGFRQDPPLRILVERGERAKADAGDLGERVAKEIRAKLLVTTKIELVPFGALPRSDYKSKLVDWQDAKRA